ncbi:hypothetical protein CHI07_21130 [Paenibacillus sp. 7884-2]|nr:hypothetical protein CHI07_21130 [Paenibacillus sp. 7884-2]
MGADKTPQEELIIDWYDKYSEAIFRYILNIINDYQQAEDLTQDTFIKVFKYIISGKLIEYPKTFIYSTAHNITVDYIRKQAPIKIVKDFVFHKKKNKEPPIENQVLPNELYKELYKEVLSLKKSYRQVIILRKMEGFSIKESAAILNWSEAKVKTTLFRAMEVLGKKLEERSYTNEIFE